MKNTYIAIAITAALAAIAFAGSGIKCTTCKGTGWNGSFKCVSCGGDGEY